MYIKVDYYFIQSICKIKKFGLNDVQ